MTDDELTDKELTCADCYRRWVLTINEQRFFIARELKEPRRCLPCRAIRRQQHQGRAIYTGTHPEPIEWRQT